MFHNHLKWFSHLTISKQNLPKKTKIDSSLRSDLSQETSNSERLVKNLYNSSPVNNVILNRRLRNCTAVQKMIFLFLDVCIFPRFFLRQNDTGKNLFFAMNCPIVGDTFFYSLFVSP